MSHICHIKNLSAGHQSQSYVAGTGTRYTLKLRNVLKYPTYQGSGVDAAAVAVTGSLVGHGSGEAVVSDYAHDETL